MSPNTKEVYFKKIIFNWSTNQIKDNPFYKPANQSKNKTINELTNRLADKLTNQTDKIFTNQF